MTTLTVRRPTRFGRMLWFMRHLGAMTVAMFLGMFVYALLLEGVLATFGSSLEEARLGQPELFLLGMVAGMSLPMVAWMRRAGHGWRRSAEMCAAMGIPAVVLIACYWLAAVSATAMCPLACATMVPAMAVAMLYRLDDYTRGHREELTV